jgi:transcriptional regulator with XRE-family HTH domain
MAPRKQTEISLAEKLTLLRDRGERAGLPVTLRAIATATDESFANIRAILIGQNANPGLRTLTALAEYFGTDLGYFACKTQADCERYLDRVAAEQALSRVALRAKELSPKGVESVLSMIDFMLEEQRKGKSGKGKE